MKYFGEFLAPVSIAVAGFVAFAIFCGSAIHTENQKWAAYIAEANKWASTDSFIECLAMDGTGYKFRSQTAKGWALRGRYESPAYHSNDGYDFVPLRGMSCVIFKASP